jgi:hypothetical protein
MLANKGLAFAPDLWRLLPAHIEFLLLGWTMQFAMGIAYWILPRFGAAGIRGRESAAWASFILLNAGVLLAGLGPVFNASPLLALLGRLAEVGSAAAFVLHAWPRVKPLSLTGWHGDQGTRRQGDKGTGWPGDWVRQRNG